MELADKVSDVLARSPARVDERKGLWAEVVTAFERNGVSATTQNLADSANGIRSRFEKMLQQLTKKL